MKTGLNKSSVKICDSYDSSKLSKIAISNSSDRGFFLYIYIDSIDHKSSNVVIVENVLFISPKFLTLPGPMAQLAKLHAMMTVGPPGLTCFNAS